MVLGLKSLLKKTESSQAEPFIHERKRERKMADLSEKKTEIESFIDSVASRSGNDDPAAIWPGILVCVFPFLLGITGVQGFPNILESQTCAFTSANTPSAVPLVYLHAIAPFSKDAPARRLVLRRIKEALIKGCLLFGIPRTLNAFYALVKVLPKDDGEESVDTEIVRKEIANPLDAKVVERGLSYFENIYRKDMPAILEPMDRLFPDLSE